MWRTAAALSAAQPATLAPTAVTAAIAAAQSAAAVAAAVAAAQPAAREALRDGLEGGGHDARHLRVDADRLSVLAPLAHVAPGRLALCVEGGRPRGGEGEAGDARLADFHGLRHLWQSCRR